MTLIELFARFRSETKDNLAPYYSSDDDVIHYANEAEKEACRRARLLIESSDTDICRIALVDGQAAYTLDPRVVRVKKVRLENKARPLDAYSWRDLDEYRPGWEEHTGTPIGWIQDAQSGVLHLYKTPDAEAVADYPYAWLTVNRLPRSDMTLSASVTFQDTGDTVTHAAHGRRAGDRVTFSSITGTTGISTGTEYFLRDVTTNTYKLAATPYDTAIALTTNGTGTASYGANEPEVNARFHNSLLHWMKYRHYSMDDPDVNDEKLAAKYLALFEQEFGPPSRAIDEEWSSTNEGFNPFDGSK